MMNNPANFSAHPPAGQQLPKDWRRNAPAIGAAANQAYLDRLQNAWKGNGNPDPNLMRQARLSSPGPSWSDLLGDK
jgi:hypothetical protein